MIISFKYCGDAIGLRVYVWANIGKPQNYVCKRIATYFCVGLLDVCIETIVVIFLTDNSNIPLDAICLGSFFSLTY